MPKSLLLDEPVFTTSIPVIAADAGGLGKKSLLPAASSIVKDRTAPPTEIIAALQSQLQDFETEFGIHTELISNITHCSLSATYLSALLHITAEALNNVHKHAHAYSVVMYVFMQEDMLRLEIIDNGIGTEINKLNQLSSTGFARMHEGALQLGGSLSVASSAGKGTMLTLTTIAEK